MRLYDLSKIILKCFLRWNSWSKQYDEDLYDTEDDPSMPHNVPLTRYPLPNLNDQGHMDMSEFGFRDTLDEYFDIFVIILR